jgi:hypothetical protein
MRELSIRTATFIAVAALLLFAADIGFAAKAASQISEERTTAAATTAAASSSTHTGTAVAPTDARRAGEQINWQVLAAGGGTQTMGSYILGSTIGQTAVGLSVMGSYQLQSGFWQNFGANYLCGDADGSGDLNISDAVYLVCYIFIDCAAPSPLAAGDNDCDGTVNIVDVVYLINYIFNDGPEPCANCK